MGRFPKTHSTTAAAVDGEPALETGSYAIADHVDYAVSKCIKKSVIGPSFAAGAPQVQKLDLLGFVVGDSRTWSGPNAPSAPTSEYLNSYPYALKPDGNI